MNDHLENITPWAEKLQQVTLPHIDENWEAMKILLDKEIPIVQNKRRQRWILLIILLLLFVGVCNAPLVLRWSRLTGKSDTTVNYMSRMDKKEAPPKTIPLLNNEGHSVKINRGKITVSEDYVPMMDNRKQINNKKGPLNYSRNTEIQIQKIHPVPQIGTQTLDSTHKITDIEERDEKINMQTNKRNEKNRIDLLAGKNEIREQELLLTHGNLSVSKINTGVVSEDSIGTKDEAGNLFSEKDQKVTETNTQKSLTKRTKADSTKDEKGFSFAIGFHQFFPVGQQKKINYNSDGGSSGLGDYIPVPIARYYFHKWLYVQAETQFNAPQYTRALLASNSVSLSPSGSDTSKSVFIKKLIYFNLPVSIHYSPFKNLYFGAGIQYSLLTGGVVLFENSKSYMLGPLAQPANDTSLISSKIGNLKKASAYGDLRRNEFRVLFNLNYQWKPFMIGARYNQAFTNFINVHISNTFITQAHNSSLQLYLSYTFWGHRKKIVFP